MPAKDLGTKRVCFKCGAKFYDLKKPQVVCPKCGTDQRDAPVAKPPPQGKRPKAPVPDPEPEVEEVEETEDVLGEALEDDAGDEDEP